MALNFSDGYDAGCKDTLRKCVVTKDRERKVIEAAKALFNGYTAEDSRQDYWKIDAVLDHRLYALFLKIEALQEARDE